MPIYEYRCSSCGHEREVLQRISDQPLTKCPACGKRAFKKLVSAAGFQLKGTGWYATDFKNKGAKPAAKKSEPSSDSSKPAETAAKDSPKTEKTGSAGASPSGS